MKIYTDKEILEIPFNQILEVKYDTRVEYPFVDRDYYARFHNDQVSLLYFDENDVEIYKTIPKNKNEELLREVFQINRDGIYESNNFLIYETPSRIRKNTTPEPVTNIKQTNNMEKNTINEMLEILTAYKEGKEIEYYDEDEKYWCWNTSPIFNFEYIYRIKPDQKLKS